MWTQSRLLIPLIIISASVQIAAQEVNIGAHLNPVFCIPAATGQSSHDPELRFSPIRLGYSYGLDISVTSGRLSIEAGAGIVEKSYSVRQFDFNTPSQINVSAKSILAVSAFEVPLLLKYQVAEHSGHASYSTHLIIGASHEWINPYIIPEDRRRDTAAAGQYQISVLSTPLPDVADFSWPNLIAGVQIRAVLLGVGLVEYGVAVHVPLQATGPFSVETIVLESGQLANTFNGEFYPRLAHVDFRLRYFFFNFKKGEGRVRYRQ